MHRGRWAVGKVGDRNAQVNGNFFILGKELLESRLTVLSLLAKGWKTLVLPEHLRCKRAREPSPLWYLLSHCWAKPIAPPQLSRALLTFQLLAFEGLERTSALMTSSSSNVVLTGWLPQKETNFNSSRMPGCKDSDPTGITG